MGKREGEFVEFLRQIAISSQPLVDVVPCEVLVVLVELVADEHSAAVVRVHPLASSEGGHIGSVTGFLHTEHYVAGISHELRDKRFDLVSQILLRFVQSKVAESWQINDLHIHAKRRLNTHVHWVSRNRIAEGLMRFTNDPHDLGYRKGSPFVRFGIHHLPYGSGKGWIVAKFQHGRPS